MAFQDQQDVVTNNRYRQKCPGSLTLPSRQRFQPYHRPWSSYRYAPMPSGYHGYPTPPCPAPGTWANTFTYDDYSVEVWGNSINHQNNLQIQAALLQREILMAESQNQYPSCAYTPVPVTPSNLAESIMAEETGYLGSIVSRVTADGDIVDDVLDDNGLPDTSNDLPAVSDDSRVCETPVPSVDSPTVFTFDFPVKREDCAPLAVTPIEHQVVLPLMMPPMVPIPTPLPHVKPDKKNRKSHQERGKYACTQCDKVFSWRAGLVTHMRIHTGERPYKCADCPKSFTDYSTYSKHCRTHSGLKPYTCDVCGKAFSQSGNRLRHMRTVHKALK